MSRLTNKQQKVVDFIWHFNQTNGYSPTLREIAEGVGIKYPSVVCKYLDRIEKRGAVKRHAAVTRGVRLVQ